MESSGEYVISDELLAEIQEQFKLWATFLNTGIGLLSFTLAVASLGTNVPWFNAFLSMIVILIIRKQGAHYFPAKVRELRKLAKTDEKAKVLLKGLESEYLSFKTLLLGYPVLLIGLIFLLLVIMSPAITKHLPSLGGYFGI